MKYCYAVFLACLLALPAWGANWMLTSGIGFSAPNVDGNANVGNPQIGDIIFDTGTNAFEGYGGSTTGWLTLGSVAIHAPTISVATTSSHSGGFNGSGTYTLPTSPTPLYIRVRMVGGGGGGAAAITNNGNNGNDTTFGGMTAGKGAGGSASNRFGGAGGSASLGAGSSGTALSGGMGDPGMDLSTGQHAIGGSGAASAFGGAGGGGAAAGIGSGQNAAANTGAGGGGGANSTNGGGGGGAGGFVDAIISSPSSTYTYTVGSGGTGGAAGSIAGGNGGDGYIEVTEYYQ